MSKMRILESNVETRFINFNKGIPIKLHDWWGDGAYDGEYDFKNIRWYVEDAEGNRKQFNSANEVWFYLEPNDSEIDTLLNQQTEEFLSFMSILFETYSPITGNELISSLGLKKFAKYSFINGVLVFYSRNQESSRVYQIYKEEVDLRNSTLKRELADKVEI